MGVNLRIGHYQVVCSDGVICLSVTIRYIFSNVIYGEKLWEFQYE